MAEDNVEQIVLKANATDLYAELLKAQSSLRNFTKEVKDNAAALSATGGFTPYITAISNLKTEINSLQTQMGGLEATGQAVHRTFQQQLDQSYGLEREMSQITKTTSMFGTSLKYAGVSATEAAAGTGVATAAMTNLRLGTSGAIREFIVLGHEIMVGNFSRIPGSMVVLSERVGGLSSIVTGLGAAGIGAVVGTLALAGAIGYLAYRSFETEKEITKLGERQGLFGRDVETSRDFVEAQSRSLEGMSSVSVKTRNAILELENSQASFSAQIRSDITQLTPAFVKAWGDDAPAALKKTVDAAADLSLRGLETLDRETLKLSDSQYVLVASLITAGKQAEATEYLMSLIGQRSGHNLVTLQQQLDDAQEHLKTLQVVARAAEMELDNPGAWQGIQTQIQETIDKINGLNAAMKESGPEVQARRQALSEALALNESLHEREGILAKLRRLEAGRDSTIAAHGDPGAIAALRQGVAEQQAILDKYDATVESHTEKATLKTFSIWKAGEDAKIKGMSVGSAERTAILQGELARAQELGEAGAKIAEQIQGQINANELAGRKKRDAAIASDDKEDLSELQKAGQLYMRIKADNLKTDLDINKKGIEAKKAMLEEDVQEGRITNEEKLRLLREYTAQEMQADIQLAEFNLTLQKEDTLGYAEAFNKIRSLKADLGLALAKIDADIARSSNKTATQQVSFWRTADNEILRSEQSLIHGIFSGRQTLTQSLLGLVGNLLEREISADLQAATMHLLFSEKELAADKAAATGGFLWHLLSNQQEVASDEESYAAKLIAQQAADGAGRATQVAAADASILTSAAEAGAAAFASTAAIPLIGPELAPGAAAAAYSATAAFTSLTPLATGTMDVPQDMVAQIHKGEGVVPAPFMQGIREMMRGGGTQTPGGDSYHVNITALDARSVRTLFMDHGGALVASLSAQKRNMNAGLVSAGKSQ